MQKFQPSSSTNNILDDEIAPIITLETIEKTPENRVVSSFIMDGDPDTGTIVLKIALIDDKIEHYQMSGTTIHMLEEYIINPFQNGTFKDKRLDADIEQQDITIQDYMYSLPEAVDKSYFENANEKLVLTSFTCLILEDGFALAIKTADKQTHMFLIPEEISIFFLDFIKELKPYFKDLR